MTEPTKLGIIEILKISTHGRCFYLRIPKEVVNSFELKVGDTLKVKMIEVMKRAA